MNKTSSELRGLLRGIWPGIQIVWMPDTVYTIPTISEVEKAIVLSGVAKKKFDGELWDCDDYSLSLNAFIKEMQRTKEGAQYHWAFGEVFGTKFRRVDELHTINICVAEEGIYFIEPQTYDIWQGESVADNPLMVKM